MGAFGQWGQGPIQFNHNSGVIESRGTIDAPPSASAGPTTSTPAPAPDGGGVLSGAPAYGGGPNPEWGGSVGGLMSSPGDAGSSIPNPPHMVDPGPGSSIPNPPHMSDPGPNNGGSYGLDGGGSGALGYDAGGLVDADDSGGMDDGDQDGMNAQQGAQAATVDPMQAVQGALAYGRRKMGVPANFTQGPSAQQSFDDGGEVGQEDGVIPTSNSPQQGQNGGQSTPLPDPRHTLMYLTGAGNVSPDIADALERKLDPQGTMNPSARTMHAIASAPSPDAAFGLMQHYRTRYNAYAGGARAALDQGNPGQAAAHATQAFQNIPTGYDVRFAPAQGGIAMSAKKLGQQQPQQSMYDGGEVESENIEDRRDEHGEGYVPKGDGPSPESVSDGVLDSYSQGRAADDKVARNRAELRGQGVVFKDKVQGFDDGGEVDDEEGVIPTDTVNEPATEPGDQSEVPQQRIANDFYDASEQQEQPQVLNPDQFKKLITAGYDKPLDDGFMPMIKRLLNRVVAGQPMTGYEGMKTPESPVVDQMLSGGPAVGNMEGPSGPARDPFAGHTQKGGPINLIKSLFGSGPAPDVTAAVTDPSETPAGQAGPTPNQQPPGGQQAGMRVTPSGPLRFDATQQRQPPQQQQPRQQPQQPQQPQQRPGEAPLAQQQARLREWMRANPYAEPPTPGSSADQLIRAGKSAVASGQPGRPRQSYGYPGGLDPSNTQSRGRPGSFGVSTIGMTGQTSDRLSEMYGYKGKDPKAPYIGPPDPGLTWEQAQAQKDQSAPQGQFKLGQGQGQPRASLDDMYEKYNALWTKMHNGMVSTGDEPQRQQFIQGMINQELKTQGTMDIETNKNRLGIAQVGAQSKAAHDTAMEAGKNARSEARIAQLRDAVTAKMAQGDRNGLLNFVRSEANSMRASQPNISDKDIADHMVRTFGVDPSIVSEGVNRNQNSGGANSGGNTGGKAINENTHVPAAINDLLRLIRSNPSAAPKTMQQYDAIFGKGAAQRVLEAAGGK